MRIVIAGAHGKIARHLGAMLVERGVAVLGLIRNPDHAEDLRADGVEPQLADLEQVDAAQLAALLSGVDAAVFAAGAGPGSGAPRKDTVDRAASALLADASERAGIRRFLQVSSMGTTRPNPPDVDPVFGAYLDAKRAAEEDLRSRDLDWTILRPGRLTDDQPTGRVTLAESVGRAEVTRADVAAVLLALLDEPAASRRALELVNGEIPISEALRVALV
ncbi:SDR family oxidoreductase [Saccharopolyspora spinosa]|uniref:Nucleoside-diphosphate-sugar epimerase n=1 Tax=Saccharopolyspora spinosa TaxID=60894 RepID=A0A2N3XS73_SACSN|nr:SDR family oxidoreductase [Saccharopolyspora spinosa]PKW13517.1 nucleoside-diphosphate-sugar epimerase [Saccharopolyspora spinosa]